MMTLRQLTEPLPSIPTATSWRLADLGQALGKQELFTYSQFGFSWRTPVEIVNLTPIELFTCTLT